MMIHLVQAEHPTAPGWRMIACATADIAEREAAACVLAILPDSPVRKSFKAVTVDNWRAIVEALEDYHGAANCTVSITPLSVREA